MSCDISYDVMWCDMVYDIIWCMISYHMIKCYIIWYHLIWCYIIWYHMILYDMTHHAIPYNTIYHITPLSWHESEKLHFEPSQNATVTNCDNSGILAVAFCDLSHFVIMAVTAQTESNKTENVFWVLGRVPMFTIDMNTKSLIFAILALLHCYICLSVCISVVKPIIDLQRKPYW